VTKKRGKQIWPYCPFKDPLDSLLNVTQTIQRMPKRKKSLFGQIILPLQINNNQLPGIIGFLNIKKWRLLQILKRTSPAGYP
jgi:hypothetical protein